MEEERVESFLTLKIPFCSKETAALVYEVVNVDKELKGSGIKREITTKDSNVNVNFHGPDLKKLRVAVTAFLKNIILVIKTIEKF